jgi:hypothetical protein
VTQPRDPEMIEREIEQTRAQLAGTLDELAERVNPKRVANEGMTALTETPRGRAIVAGGAGLVALRLLLAVVSRIRRRRRRR